ncbi:TetR/AcrR family transcriptional regulator [Mycoplasma sp. P36-A1]|uniref:TetR/AcrR family transcriptional regulator n=1 Tax=Mycoplasma sp. P36-A1 TaxID=3252900 RepID=UPI003C2B209F
MSRDKILLESLNVIKENGLENFSMRKLAEVLKIKPASIYHYFKSKEEILNAIYIHGVDLLIESENMDAKDFEEYFLIHIKNLLENKIWFRFVFRYREAAFLTDETKVMAKKYQKVQQETFNKMLEEKSYFKKTEENRFIIEGTILQLMYANRKISDKQLKIVIRKLLAAIKEE